MLVAQQPAVLVVPTVENGEELCIRVCFNVFCFCFRQNQISQIIIKES